MKKRNLITKFVGISVVSILLLLVGCVVFAYFTDNNTKDNTVTPAENIIDVSEDYTPPTEQFIGDNIYKKEITISNNGNTPCYIRVYMDFSDSKVRNRSYFSNDWDGSTGHFYSAKRETTGETYIAKLSEAAPNWAFIPDSDDSPLAGYYYYTKLVPVGQSTKPLFTYVKTHNETNDDIQQYDIIVYSESIQKSDIDGKVYNNYEEAWTDFLSKSMS